MAVLILKEKMNLKTSIKILEVVIYPDGRMNTEGASLYTGLSNKTLAMMRCDGTGPKFIKRGRIFYYRADVDDWLNADGRLTSTAQAQQVSRIAKKL